MYEPDVAIASPERRLGQFRRFWPAKVRATSATQVMLAVRHLTALIFIINSQEELTMFAQQNTMKCFVSAAIIRIYKATVLPCMHTSLLLLLAIPGWSAAPTESRCAITALDKTDCNGVVLDDSAFAEAIVRDHGKCQRF